MPTLRFAEDTADPVRIQIGTAAAPQNLTGATVAMRLRNLSTGAVITAGTTTIESPETDGVIERAWESGEQVAGRSYLFEAVVTFGDGTERTYPGPDEDPLIVEIVARRTAA